ncbi:hypothetical protein WG219_08365 [Ectopseudomonas mendocina]|uniref:Periplasmic protein-like protein n=1 Tax=Ectopseudomonas mendocina TaxID=300 RepID=A0ABZ2RMV9_ECTME
MRPLLIQLLLTLGLALSSGAALAKVDVQAGMHKTLGMMLVVKISEDIVPGDYEALLRGIRQHPGKYQKKIAMLDSIGGNVTEAMKLGRLLRETGFETLVPSTGVCQGSCVYVLVAGVKKSVRGHVGLHKPYYAGSDSIHSVSRSNDPRYSATTYFREMGMPMGLLELMLSTQPNRMRVLTRDELVRYKLTPETLPAVKPKA